MYKLSDLVGFRHGYMGYTKRGFQKEGTPIIDKAGNPVYDESGKRKIKWRWRWQKKQPAFLDRYIQGKIVGIGELEHSEFIEDGEVIDEMDVQHYCIEDEKTGKIYLVADWQLDEYVKEQK